MAVQPSNGYPFHRLRPSAQPVARPPGQRPRRAIHQPDHHKADIQSGIAEVEAELLVPFQNLLDQQTAVRPGPDGDVTVFGASLPPSLHKIWIRFSIADLGRAHRTTSEVAQDKRTHV